MDENDKRENLVEELGEFDETLIFETLNDWEGGSLSTEIDFRVQNMTNESLEDFIKELKQRNSSINLYSKINNLFSRLDKEEKTKIAEELMSEARESY